MTGSMTYLARYEIQRGETHRCPECGGASWVRSAPTQSGRYIGRRRVQYRKCHACAHTWVTWFAL